MDDESNERWRRARRRRLDGKLKVEVSVELQEPLGDGGQITIRVSRQRNGDQECTHTHTRTHADPSRGQKQRIDKQAAAAVHTITKEDCRPASCVWKGRRVGDDC